MRKKQTHRTQASITDISVKRRREKILLQSSQEIKCSGWSPVFNQKCWGCEGADASNWCSVQDIDRGALKIEFFIAPKDAVTRQRPTWWHIPKKNVIQKQDPQLDNGCTTWKKRANSYKSRSVVSKHSLSRKLSSSSSSSRSSKGKRALQENLRMANL